MTASDVKMMKGMQRVVCLTKNEKQLQLRELLRHEKQKDETSSFHKKI